MHAAGGAPHVLWCFLLFPEKQPRTARVNVNVGVFYRCFGNVSSLFRPSPNLVSKNLVINVSLSLSHVSNLAVSL